MKLLIITSEKLNPDSILTSIFELCQAEILSASFEVSILSVDQETSLASKIKQSLFHPFGSRSDSREHGFLSELKALIFRRKLVNEYIIDDIPVFESVGFSWKGRPSFAWQVKKWIVTGMQGFDAYTKKFGMPDLVHAHGRFLNAGALALAIKEKYHVNYVYTEHSTYFQRGIVPSDAIPLLKKVYDGASVYTVVSESLRRNVESTLQLPLPKARVVPNALNVIFEAPLEQRVAKERFIFTVVASLVHKKGIDVLVKAFRGVVDQRKNVMLNICGEGPLREEIEKLILSIGLGNDIVMSGGKKKEEVLKLLSGADAFVLPSRIETFAVVVIEALSRGLPVVATRSGGPEFILNEANGILTEPDDPSALTRALIELLDNYERFDRQRIRQFAISRYGSTSFLATMEGIYGEVV